MTGSDYTQALADVTAELERALREKMALDARIVKLQNAKTALSVLCDKPLPIIPNWLSLAPSVSTLQQLGGLGGEDLGLTSAVRTIFQIQPTEWLAASDVKDLLDARQFDWSSYSQPMAALHTVLKRLTDRWLETKMEDGKTAYRKRAVTLLRRRRSQYTPNLGSDATKSLTAQLAEKLLQYTPNLGSDATKSLTAQLAENLLKTKDE